MFFLFFVKKYNGNYYTERAVKIHSIMKVYIIRMVAVVNSSNEMVEVLAFAVKNSTFFFKNVQEKKNANMNFYFGLRRYTLLCFLSLKFFHVNNHESRIAKP